MDVASHWLMGSATNGRTKFWVAARWKSFQTCLFSFRTLLFGRATTDNENTVTADFGWSHGSIPNHSLIWATIGSCSRGFSSKARRYATVVYGSFALGTKRCNLGVASLVHPHLQ